MANATITIGSVPIHSTREAVIEAYCAVYCHLRAFGIIDLTISDTSTGDPRYFVITPGVEVWVETSIPFDPTTEIRAYLDAHPDIDNWSGIGRD